MSRTTGCHREGRHERGGDRAVRQLRDDEDERKQAECAATRAGQIVRAARRARLVRCDDPYGDERDGQHHRDLDEEDPTPVQRVGHEPSEHEPHREARAPARAEDPQCAVALLPLGERRRDERDRGRHRQRRPDALQGPRHHEHGGPGGQAAGQRHRAEERKSQHEGAPPAHQVGHPAAEEQQAAIGQHVRVGDPREPALADVEVRADARQRDLRDRQVERVEHDRRADHEENERLACARHPHDGYPARRTPSHTDSAVRHNPWL
jgi:hypothetical protein